MSKCKQLEELLNSFIEEGWLCFGLTSNKDRIKIEVPEGFKRIKIYINLGDDDKKGYFVVDRDYSYGRIAGADSGLRQFAAENHKFKTITKHELYKPMAKRSHQNLSAESREEDEEYGDDTRQYHVMHCSLLRSRYDVLDYILTTLHK